eukprot:m.107716 g.107716  ORF g.107716 m.107716 type:complete len:137 (-) comp12698_c0_seq5:906-1316(-)
MSSHCSHFLFNSPQLTANGASCVMRHVFVNLLVCLFFEILNILSFFHSETFVCRCPLKDGILQTFLVCGETLKAVYSLTKRRCFKKVVLFHLRHMFSCVFTFVCFLSLILFQKESNVFFFVPCRNVSTIKRSNEDL